MIHNDTNMGLSIVMEIPKNGWFLLGKIHLKWMMTGGAPILGNHQYGTIKPTTAIEPQFHGADWGLQHGAAGVWDDYI